MNDPLGMRLQYYVSRFPFMKWRMIMKNIVSLMLALSFVGASAVYAAEPAATDAKTTEAKPAASAETKPAAKKSSHKHHHKKAAAKTAAPAAEAK